MTAEQFVRAIDANVFPDKAGSDSGKGGYYEKMGKNTPHFIASLLIHAVFLRALPRGVDPLGREPILVNDVTAPMPDLVVLRGAPRDYDRRWSSPRSRTSASWWRSPKRPQRYRGVALRTYASAGLPVYWIVNLVERRIEVFEGPRVDDQGVASYERASQYEIGQDVPLVLDGHEVARVPVGDLMPEGAPPEEE